ncbi:putative dehydrogenase [Kribbella aluminosa]|uniref:Dehydrogenase n=1 Tax=Kribbella aluminosa TaxID=416017 RepID=A0ABS4UKB1_9ACTN|nr:Gfo/Idh/MocA family oxidoreductase [Kribbella aluminosa]MBP2352092.1 putative dehydrogenase [Kribbella aluminosa]
MPAIRRYAVCGLSARGLASFVLPILGLTDRTDRTAEGGFGYGSDEDDLSGYAEVVAIVDTDADRVTEFNRSLEALGRAPIPFFAEYEEMLKTVVPDAVIVTSPDHTHEQYIHGALRHDIDVITEKPMVTTAAAAREVLAAERASGGSVQVTHNLRYAAAHREVKRLIQAGTIGRVARVVMDYHVDLRHGASYFLRWNRRRALSGGLQVHKSSHHFDLLNWWIGETPEELFGYGALNYYGPSSPHRAQRAEDPYFLAQQGSGVFPDEDSAPRADLFGLHYPDQYPADRPLYIYDAEIDIEDTYSAVARYPGGAILSYSIDFSSTWEGFRLSIAGTHGSIDLLHGRTVDGAALPGSDRITVAELFGPTRVVEVTAEAGGHGGADPLMRHDLFAGPSPESVALGLMATSTEAAYAVAMGDALIQSSTTHRPVNLPHLLA